jgi:glycosyltransferase involved in cell wall biosynthesis
MKQIFINGRYLTQRITGVQRVATEVVFSLDRFLEAGTLGGGCDVTLLAPTGNYSLPNLKSIRLVQGGRFSGHPWEQLDLPRLARGGVLFNPCGPSPLFHPCQVTMLPDASIFMAPQGYSFAYRTWTRLLYRVAGFRAKSILTISNYSKGKLLEYCKTISRGKIHVVYLGSDHVLRCGIDDGILGDIFGNTRRDYVLCVGSQQANKNVKIVARVSGWLNERGVSTIVTGGSSKAVFRGEEFDEEKVTKTGYVTDEQLRALYENASCFIFPSFEEGFGIPPLEAMRCGCPVVASSSASMPEVCGDAAVYFDPRDAESLKAALDSVLKDPEVAGKLRAAGLVQTERYNWDHSALAIWGYLEREASLWDGRGS